jgi:hypothetical protein
MSKLDQVKSYFRPEYFTPTEWSTREDKAKFAIQFVKFVGGGYKFSNFPKWFYTRLSLTFGHIAHYNQAGFYETFFTTDEGKQRFWEITMNFPCYGNPAVSYSDVEKLLQEWFKRHPVKELD